MIASFVFFFKKSNIKLYVHFFSQTCFFHTGGFFAPIDGGLYNGFKIVFRNANEKIPMDSLLRNIHDHRPSVMVCGSHHAVQISNINDTDSSHYDLTSVKIFIPLGAAVHPDLVTRLKRHFPSMLPVITRGKSLLKS